MFRTSIGLRLALGSMIAFAPLAAWAQAGSTSMPAVAPSLPEIPTPQEAADWNTVRPVLNAFNSGGGYGAIMPHLAELLAVLDRAPASYPKVVDHGDRIYVRAEDREDLVVQARLLAQAHPGVSFTLYQAPAPYILASLLIGSYDNEIGQGEAALKALDRGLAIQPGNLILTSEKAAALALLKRIPEMLSLVTATLATPDIPPLRNAHLLRQQGYALVELERLDEAETAYRQSLQLEPDNAGAKNELAYIAQLRGGARATPGFLVNSKDSAAGNFPGGPGYKPDGAPPQP